MKIEQFQLPLENGETITCSRTGQGQRIGFIVGGPGSFYFNGLSSLADEYTFVTCDALWKYSKSVQEKSEMISAVTKETIKERDHLVVKALKTYFKTDTIDGFGFSAPGALLFEEALEHPDDFEHLIGTGIGLTELAPTFVKTNKIFYDQADRERELAFEEYQSKYNKFQSFVSKKDAPEENVIAFFDVKPSKIIDQLTENDSLKNEKKSEILLRLHKRFVTETIAMAPKLLFNLSDAAEVKKIIVGHLKHNPFREHIDKRMQEHFFNNIYPQMQPLVTLLKVAETNKKILLVYDNTDFVTPLLEDIKKQLSQTPNVELKVIPNSSHMPYIEAQQKYAEIIISFIIPRQTHTKVLALF